MSTPKTTVRQKNPIAATPADPVQASGDMLAGSTLHDPLVQFKVNGSQANSGPSNNSGSGGGNAASGPSVAFNNGAHSNSGQSNAGHEASHVTQQSNNGSSGSGNASPASGASNNKK